MDTVSSNEHALRCRQLWAALVTGLLADAVSPGRGSAANLIRRYARSWFTSCPDRGIVLSYAGIDPYVFESRVLLRLRRAWAEADQLRLTQGRRPGRPRHEGQAAA